MTAKDEGYNFHLIEALTELKRDLIRERITIPLYLVQ
jgi:hypothetical protein